MLTDRNYTHGTEDLMEWVTVEPLYWIFENNVRSCINDTSIKKERKHKDVELRGQEPEVCIWIHNCALNLLYN